MNCKSVQPLISAFIDGELAASEALLVKRHLSHCRKCREEECQMRYLKSILSGVPEAMPPADFEERLHHAVFSPARPQTGSLSGRGAAMALTGITLMAASLTFLALSFASSQSEPAGRDSALAFEVPRDQATLAGADPFAGNITIVPTNYGP